MQKLNRAGMCLFGAICSFVADTERSKARGLTRREVKFQGFGDRVKGG